MDDKYNQYGEVLDELGYGLMNKIEDYDYTNCNHEIQFFSGPDHIECLFCKRYFHKNLRAHCALCYKIFCQTCLKQFLRQDFPKLDTTTVNKENKVVNNRLSTLETRINQIEKTVDFLYENFERGNTNASDTHEINSFKSLVETRLDQLEKTVSLLCKEKEKVSPDRQVSTSTSGLMALQNKDCIPIICNRKINKSLHILVKINLPKINNFDKTEVVLQALLYFLDMKILARI